MLILASFGRACEPGFHRGEAYEYMEQRSVLTQTTRPEECNSKWTSRWMRHFFTEDVTPDNHSIVDLQQRALWIGIAFIL